MKYIRNKNNKIHKKFTKQIKMQRNKFGIYRFDHANMFTMLLRNFLPKIGLHMPYLLEILICDNMHLICINYNNIINKPFSAKKNFVAILFTCVLTSMQNFAVIGPFGVEIWRGGQIDPRPSWNLLSKSPVRIGLMQTLPCMALTGHIYEKVWSRKSRKWPKKSHMYYRS